MVRTALTHAPPPPESEPKSFFAPAAEWRQISGKAGAIVRAFPDMRSEIVAELEPGTAVVTKRTVITKHNGKDLKRTEISVPNEGWVSAKRLVRNVERCGPAPPKAEKKRRPRPFYEDPDDQKADDVHEAWSEKRPAVAVADAAMTAEDCEARVTKVLATISAPPVLVGTGAEQSRAAVLGTAGPLEPFSNFWKRRDFGVFSHGNRADGGATLRTWLTGADRVVLHCVGNDGFAYACALLAGDAAFAEALRGKLFVVLDSCPKMTGDPTADRAAAVAALTAHVCRSRDEPPNAAHPRYAPAVGRSLEARPPPVATDAVPTWAPVLVFYSEADAVVSAVNVDAYLDTRDDATGMCKFADTPHVHGSVLRPNKYAAMLDLHMSGAYIPAAAKPAYYANAYLGLRTANSNGATGY